VKTIKFKKDKATAVILQLHVQVNGETETIKIDLSPHLPSANKNKTLLLDWLDEKTAEANERVVKRLRSVKRHLAIYIEEHYQKPVCWADVDKDFCTGFVQYLDTAKNLRVGKDNAPRYLSANTRNKLFVQFASIVSLAVREGQLSSNPIQKMHKTEKPRPVTTDRPYLTIPELRMLSSCTKGPAEVRRAFLFSCLSGLRWSDISTLRWKNLHQEDGKWFVAKQMIKTGEWIHNPVSEEARRLLPTPAGQGGDLVFILPSATAANSDIKRWALAAGINKNISFHTARHTFATLLLTLGADIYTTSKLLGHTNLCTTQVYARVVDKKKQDAVNLMEGVMNLLTKM